MLVATVGDVQVGGCKQETNFLCGHCYQAVVVLPREGRTTSFLHSACCLLSVREWIHRPECVCFFLMPREDTNFGKHIEATQKITCLVFFTLLP